MRQKVSSRRMTSLVSCWLPQGLACVKNPQFLWISRWTTSF